MNILVWDTSSTDGVVALGVSQGKTFQCLESMTLSVLASRAEGLLWAIDTLLTRRGMTLQELDLLGVGLGPGSFTGIRIGVTTAKIFARFGGMPLVGVSSLEVLLRPACLPHQVARVAVPACRGEFFVGSWDGEYYDECLSTSQDGATAFKMSGDVLGQVCYEQFMHGKKEAIRPRYLRASHAEIKRGIVC